MIVKQVHWRIITYTARSTLRRLFRYYSAVLFQLPQFCTLQNQVITKMMLDHAESSSPLLSSGLTVPY